MKIDSPHHQNAFVLIDIIRRNIANGQINPEGLFDLSKRFSLNLDLTDINSADCAALVAAKLQEMAIADNGKSFWKINDFLECHWKIPPKRRYLNMVRAAEIQHALDRSRTAVEETLAATPVDDKQTDQLYSKAREQCLRQFGVLDKKGRVIPGQEMFLGCLDKYVG